MGNRNFTVGIFVSFALAALVWLTLWLSGQQGAAATSRYSMYFARDVSGLMLGGPVFYLGVEVGNVTHMQIIPGDPSTVRVDIDVLESTPVDTGTWASLYYQGITGVAVINLYGDPGMNLPLKKPPGEANPVIEVRDAGLAAVLADAPSITQKIDRLLDRLGQLVGEENRQLVTDTLSNLERLSSALAENEAAFAGLPQEINDTLAEVRTSLVELRGAVQDMRPGLETAVDGLASASTDLSSVIARLDSWTEENDADMQDFMTGGLGEFPALVGDARAALREIEKLVRDLREDPSRLIYRPEQEINDE